MIAVFAAAWFEVAIAGVPDVPEVSNTSNSTFIPVFALSGMEGKMFHPLAFTKTFAMVSSTILPVTLVPVLCTFLIRGKLHREEDNPVMRVLRAIYKPILRTALRFRLATIVVALALFGAAIFALTGGVFLVKLLGYNFSVAV